MRVGFCGSGTFALPTLRAIAASGHEVGLVVSQPPRPAGRGVHLRPTPVAQQAAALGLPLFECPRVNTPQAVEVIAASRPDVLVVVDFGQLIGWTLRRLPPHGALNLHGSLLPELRGAAPVNWAIIRGYGVTGVTTFRLVRRLDAGPVYLRDQTPIDPHETAEELKTRLADLGAEQVCRTLGLLAGGWIEPQPQDESRVTEAPRLSKSDGLIDWTASAVDIRNLVHGTWPWPGGQATLLDGRGREVPGVLARATVAEGPARGEPGRLDDELCVSTGEGRLALLEIQPAGKRLMRFRDFANGHRLTVGNRFLTIEEIHG